MSILLTCPKPTDQAVRVCGVRAFVESLLLIHEFCWKQIKGCFHLGKYYCCLQQYVYSFVMWSRKIWVHPSFLGSLKKSWDQGYNLKHCIRHLKRKQLTDQYLKLLSELEISSSWKTQEMNFTTFNVAWWVIIRTLGDANCPRITQTSYEMRLVAYIYSMEYHTHDWQIDRHVGAHWKSIIMPI